MSFNNRIIHTCTLNSMARKHWNWLALYLICTVVLGREFIGTGTKKGLAKDMAANAFFEAFPGFLEK